MIRIRILPALVALVVAVGCGKKQPPPTAQQTVHMIPSPAPPGSAEPSLSAGGGQVLLAWMSDFAAGHAFEYARLESGAWSETHRIVAGDLFANAADVPTVVPLADGGVAAAWLRRHDANQQTFDVEMARSVDGRNFSAAQVPHPRTAQTEHGFVSLVPDPMGGATIVWLDGRDRIGKEESDLSGRTCLVAAEFERGAFGKDHVLDPKVCDCCRTAAVRTLRGVLVAYRDRSDDEVRDIALVRRQGDTWTAPYPLHRDGWRLAGCPVNGPALAASGDLVAAAWFTMVADTAQVRVAFSNDAGATFSRPIRADEGNPAGRVDIALLPSGDAILVWIEMDDHGATTFRARGVRQDGRMAAAFQINAASSGRIEGFPRVACTPDSVYFATTEGPDPSRVRIASMGSASFMH
jgi:hypothetical protein